MAFLHTPHLQPSLHQHDTFHGNRKLAEYQQHMSSTEMDDAAASTAHKAHLTHKTVAIRVESIVLFTHHLESLGLVVARGLKSKSPGHEWWIKNKIKKKRREILFWPVENN